MRTIGRRFPEGIGPDRVALCSYCGVQYRRSQLTRDASQNLACPDCAPGLDIVSLTEGNARLMRSRQPKTVGPADGNFDEFTSPPDPGFVNPNGAAPAPYLPPVDPYVPNTLAFPATYAPRVWFDGNQQAFADNAGLIPNGFGFVRRLNEIPSLAGVWLAEADTGRPYRDGNSLRFECIGSNGGYSMLRGAAAGMTTTDCTLVASFVPRDNAYAGPAMGLFGTSDRSVGIIISSNQVWIDNPVALWFSSLTVTQGALNTITVRYTNIGIELSVTVNGTTTTDSVPLAMPTNPINAGWLVGRNGAGYQYCSVTQAIAGPGASAAIVASVGAWAATQRITPAYPDNRALISIVGDSIPRGTGANYNLTYPFRALEAIRATRPMTENCDTAVGGFGVAGVVTGGANTPFFMSKRFYASTRIKNIMVVALGTNDLANGNPVEFVLYGTGSPFVSGSGLYPLCDAARALGYKVILATIGPRSDAMGVTQAAYDAARDAANNDMAANWRQHADAFADTRIPLFGRNGDSNNPTYYSVDKVHPNNAGHGVVYPVFTAAILSLL